MESVFVRIFNMSIVASWLILAVIILRLILKKAPKRIRYVMWAMVGVRLALPFSFESGFSLVPNAQRLNEASGSSTTYIGSHTGESLTANAQSTSVDALSVISIVWAVGAALMLVYMIASFLSLSKMVRERIRLRDNIWLCDRIQSPFVLGVFRPQIYLLSSMSERETEYVIAHEKTHLKHLDNIWKPLGFVLLCMHWFNPLCWLAYWLFNKDIELACDESVVKGLDIKGKKQYSTALLSCSSFRHIVTACPLAFGENNIKQRIVSILSYKKPTVRVLVVALAACTAVAVSFMTDPLSTKAVNTVLSGLGSDAEIGMPVKLGAKNISEMELNKIYSLISDKIENNSDKEYTDGIDRVELNEQNSEILVYIKNLDEGKQKWFEENICKTPYVVFVNVKIEPAVSEDTQPATEAVTEEVQDNDENEDEYSDNSYDESYTDDYSDYGYSDGGYSDYSDYSDDSYYSDSSDNSDNSGGVPIVPITPFEPDYDSYNHIYDDMSYGSGGGSYGLSSGAQRNKYTNSDEIWRATQWDINPQNAWDY